MQALLRLVLSPDHLDRALVDLADIYARVVAERGSSAAARVYRSEALAIVCWAVADRLRRRLEPQSKIHTTSPRREASMHGTFIADLRFGVRSLRRRPAFSLVVVVVMALGIGANVAIFTLANRLFLQPPPLVEAPGELVRVFRASSGGYGSALGHPDYVDYREGGREVVDLVASSSAGALTGSAGGARIQADVAVVSDNYFEMLGVRPARGRFFLPGENATPGTHPVAAISWRLWQDYFGGADEVLGKVVVLNGTPLTIVGVVPRGFRGITAGEEAEDVYTPVMMYGTLFPRSDEAWRIRNPDFVENWLQVVGRLRAGETVGRAQAALAAVASRIDDGDHDDGRTVYVTGKYRWYPTTHDTLEHLTRLMMFAVLGLLAVAAVNIAVLFLARASARSREIGILAALGAGRVRVVRQFVTESTLLALIGGAGGVVLATAAARIAAGLLPVRLDPPPSPDGRVFVFAVGLSLVTAAVVGIVPGLRAASSDVVGQIQGRGHVRGGRLRDGLIVVQVALSLALVAGAALFARSLSAARDVNPGFETGNTLLVPVDLTTRDYDAPRARAFMQSAMERMAGLPDVGAVSTTATAPFRGQWSTTIKPWPGSTLVDTAGVELALNTIAPGYFEAIRLPIVAGRGFDARDRDGAPDAVIINQAFATMAFGTTDVVGRTIPLRGDDGPDFTIVGVARDASYYDFGTASEPLAYLSAMQRTRLRFTFIVKTADDPALHTRAVTKVVQDLDPQLAIGSIETLDGIYGEQLAGYRASANVVGLSGLIALVLAAVGLYGVMAFRVAQGTRDIGIRMALGATRWRVAGDVLTRGLRLTVAGVALGLGTTILLGRFVRGLLYGVPAADPVALTVAPIVLLVVAVAAVMVPARRAMAVDPMRAIRAE